MMIQVKEFIIPPHRPLRWLLPVLVGVMLLLLQWLQPAWSARAEVWSIDARFRLRGEIQPQTPIVIVALDEDSFQMMGELHGENIRTWPRRRWAELVDLIRAGNPQFIGIDIIFDTPGWDEGGDEALAAALALAGNVILPANLEQNQTTQFQNATLSLPIARLAQYTAATGVSSVPLDTDGAIRRQPLLYSWGDQSWPAYALAVATLFNGAPIDVPQADLGTDLSLLINYRGPEGTFKTVSLYDLWSGTIDSQIFEDAIVLIGYTTHLEHDRHLTPFTGKKGMPGVEIQANAIDTLLAGDWLRQTPAWFSMLIMALAALGTIGAFNFVRPEQSVLLTVGGLFAYLLLGLAFFVYANRILPWAAPLTVVLSTGGVALAERSVFVEREKRLMRRRFAGVMSPERLRAVMGNWEDLTRSDREPKEAAVLFADIRGFTHATETLMRREQTTEMVEFLSAYLDLMADAVFAEGGVIYRMLGDGLLILFGLPEPLPNHSLSAVRAAVGMATAIRTLQSQWPLQNEAPLGMGIGINTGVMLDAIVGHGRRLDYSIIGDSVNTAARIEAHCKVAMEIPRPAAGTIPEEVTILLGADLYEQVREYVLADENIPPFAARGKSDPVMVVRLLGLRDQAGE